MSSARALPELARSGNHWALPRCAIVPESDGTHHRTMGLTYVKGDVTGPTGRQATVRFLVDSGATYTLLAEPDWRAIKLTPTRSVTFTLADGTEISRQVSECHLRLPQGEAQGKEIGMAQSREASDNPLGDL